MVVVMVVVTSWRTSGNYEGIVLGVLGIRRYTILGLAHVNQSHGLCTTHSLDMTSTRSKVFPLHASHVQAPVYKQQPQQSLIASPTRPRPLNN